MFSLLRCGCRLRRLESADPCLCAFDHNWFTCLLTGCRPVQEIAGLENIRATADKMHSMSPGLNRSCAELVVREWEITDGGRGGLCVSLYFPVKFSSDLLWETFQDICHGYYQASNVFTEDIYIYIYIYIHLFGAYLSFLVVLLYTALEDT